MRVALCFVLGCASGSSGATVVEVPPIEPLPTVTPVTPSVPPPLTAHGRHLDGAECVGSPMVFVGNCRLVARVQIADLRTSSSTCYVDTVIHTGDVGQVLDCPSGGVIAFDRTQFVGSVDGSSFDVCTGSTFPFNDGCTWRSVQRIQGSTGSLLFSYTESIAQGAGCAPSSCTAHARVEVIP